MEEGAEKKGPRTGEAQNASSPNANTLWRRHAARPLGALSSRTARRIGERPTNSDIDEEVDGGGCRAGEAGRNGWEARESAWGRDARAFEAGPHRVTNCVHDFRLEDGSTGEQVNRIFGVNFLSIFS